MSMRRLISRLEEAASDDYEKVMNTTKPSIRKDYGDQKWGVMAKYLLTKLDADAAADLMKSMIMRHAMDKAKSDSADDLLASLKALFDLGIDDYVNPKGRKADPVDYAALWQSEKGYKSSLRRQQRIRKNKGW
jgi:hypothetical protein